MLLELRLENYAVIDNLTVEFSSGLNLLSGETGAGKSILIDALALLLGEKASSEIIRTGAEKALLSAVFELQPAMRQQAQEVLDRNGITWEDDVLVLRREIAPGGKGRVFVNSQPATVAVLRQVASCLAAIHAQNESILSFGAEARLGLLDQFASIDLEATAAAFLRWKTVAARIEELQRDEQDRLRLLDLWTFQAREIEEARLQAGEDELLQAEKRVLANSEKIYTAAMNAFNLLYEGDSSCAHSVRSAEKNVEELSRFAPQFQESLQALTSARITIEDIAASLRDYAAGVHSSPERLAEVEERLVILDRLRRKYGATVEDVIRFGAEVSRKASEIENQDETIRQLRAELSQAGEEYLRAANSVSRQRQEAAKRLEKLTQAELRDLAMKANLKIDLRSSNEQTNWTAHGIDHLTFMIATNPGEPLRRLEQIASGGELSRVMLALKVSVETAAARGKNNPAAETLVFDEIDAGIGGRAAEAVGRKLKSLARASQVLCVTHLPQIATFADHHYVIEKKDSAARTRTTVRKVVGQERTEEIARMLSGAKLTDTSRKHAEQMLKANA
ncbi:MAG: DNA repair protein RecN [Acidobacteriales bacterium]|nr:DNA repair protein RecN [Terriglobales bacterium]